MASKRKTVTFDLGTHLGWGQLDGDTVTDSGTELLATDTELLAQRKDGRERTGDIRIDRFKKILLQQLAGGAERIVYEDVLFAGSSAQTQLWASLRAVIWLVGADANVEVCCVAVATLKRFAAGDGGAKKPEMARSLAAADPSHYELDPGTGLLSREGQPMDDNEVDAIWLARYTAAVDRGEASFLAPHQRKAAAKAARRQKRALAKAAKKAHTKAEQLADRAKRRAVLESIRAAGRCCGVLRLPAPFGRAVCPKCGRLIRIPAPPVAVQEVLNP